MGQIIKLTCPFCPFCPFCPYGQKGQKGQKGTLVQVRMDTRDTRI